MARARPAGDGRPATFYREIRSRGIDVPVTILSAHGAEGAQREPGADGRVRKPFDPDDLIRAVRDVLP